LIIATALPTPKEILTSGGQAADYYLAHNNVQKACGWTRGTFMIGLIKFYSALVKIGVPADKYHQAALVWANNNRWLICTEGGDTHNPNNQLSGSTYLELYEIANRTNATWIQDTVNNLNDELTKTYPAWSWVDTMFMGLNTWSRVYKIFQAAKYSAKIGSLFDTVRVTKKFWNDTESLWYRDGGFLKSNVFWGRGNGWAIGSLVDTIRYYDTSLPEYKVIVENFKQHAAKLKSIQGTDGCWRSSLTDPINYPIPETTGTSGFAYALAFGINQNILSKNDYLPVVENAWNCITKTALQPSGLLGYCEPAGYEPNHNIHPDSTSDFCVGLFLCASTEVAVLAS